MKENKARTTYSVEYIYDKYIFSVDKFDTFFSYVATGSIPLLLVFSESLAIKNNLYTLIISMSLFAFVIIVNLMSWFMSMASFEKWVEEASSKNKDNSIDCDRKLIGFLMAIKVIFFSAAIVLALVFVTTNLS